MRWLPRQSQSCPAPIPPGSRTAPPAWRTRAVVVCGGRSSRHRNLLENSFNHFTDGETFNFKFRPEDQPMFEHRNSHRLDVVGRDEVASAHRRIGASSQQKALRGARAGSDEHTLVLTGAANDINDVTEQLL